MVWELLQYGVDLGLECPQCDTDRQYQIIVYFISELDLNVQIKK
ncbi:hypothetical protein PPEP_a1144 [Pseudoalteromonas peptidolytica F12-50-A1]|uniref:Uncharacterized protein n=1 Tax=Pseudoalteromonas peptidolytica F12-50-A1 TaxID=1315280 RepID=A0A8I0MUN0_9GAMM|nr:hypothetical protein [Pseudoalteromonas peptidolytica F12-50-A1]